MAAPILFVGDLHLGRSPHRLAAFGLDTTRLDPAEAWRRVVREARERGVQAVVLAGDVVDQDKDRFEAWSHLRDGTTRLVEGGVRVLGVAGNHDHVALPRLADRIPAFHLLGRGGVWECVALDGVDVVGWSFPDRFHRGDPSRDPTLSRALERCRSGVTTLGVLHADLDATDSPYAPVSRASLAALGLGGWFLGHVHQPGELGSPAPIGYLGSLVGLDRSETGPRGPWLVEPVSGAAFTARQLALGPVHWLDVQVDVTGLLPGSDAPDRLHAALVSALAARGDADPWIRDGAFDAVGCSVSFVGRTAARSEIREFVDRRAPDELRFEQRGVPWAVVHLRDATLPPRDLGVLAEERSPLGHLARLLVAMDERGASAVPPEVARAVAAVDLAPWTPDPERDPPPDPFDVVRGAALALLDRLLVQRDAWEVSS